MSRTKIRAKLTDGTTRLRLLIQHPMHTGRQRDPNTGVIIPPHYIKRLTVEHKGERIVDCQLSTAVSRDPHLAFQFAGGTEGDLVRVTWEDNLGEKDQQETVIHPSKAE
ncbi:MAG: thiosulfate oxidation carrier complex protein SoxZ [Methylotetracoccus sp.]|nr:thiosulfate oxidation carrier complex protein SoxZ [Methylotetracoccus sp.]